MNFCCGLILKQGHTILISFGAKSKTSQQKHWWKIKIKVLLKKYAGIETMLRRNEISYLAMTTSKCYKNPFT